MKDKLQELVNNNPKNLVTQRIKKHQDVYVWVLEQTQHLGNVAFGERIHYILNDLKDPFCSRGKKRTISKDRKSYGFCGNTDKCECFRLHMKNVNTGHVFSEKSKEKRRQTYEEKYGVKNIFLTPAVQEKRLASIKSEKHKKTLKRLQKEKQDLGFEQVVERVSSAVEPVFTKDEYKGCFRKNFYDWKCNTCGNIFQDHIDYGRIPRCIKCNPHHTSDFERDIGEYIKQLGEEVVFRDREILDGKELDIVIPSKKVAIECHGVYWHSTKFKERDYHSKKYNACKEKDFHLIQIFEDEWDEKSEIIKERIKNLFNKGAKTHARNTDIREITGPTYREFIEKHHLQGYASASFKAGLYHQNQLVAVMSFSQGRYNTGWELVRYCSVGTVVGGASKLFKYFLDKKKPTEVHSYASRNWSQGKLYEKLGFINETKDPNNFSIWYVKGSKRYHRSSFTKKRLTELGYDSTKTGDDIMDSLGFLTLCDAGNYKFVWRNS